MAAFTNTQSGNVNDGATFGNTSPGVAGTDYPDPNGGDTLNIINGSVVTMGVNYSIGEISIGNNTAGTAELILDSDITVTMTGDLKIFADNGKTSILTQKDGVTLDIGVNTLFFDWQNWFSNANAKWSIQGTSVNRARVTGSAAGGHISYKTSGAPAYCTIDWEYCDFDTLDQGSSVHKVNGGANGISVSNCTFKNMGGIQFGHGFTVEDAAFDIVDFRNIAGRNGIASNYSIQFRLQSSTPARVFNRITTHNESSVLRVYNFTDDVTFTNSIFHNSHITGQLAVRSKYQYCVFSFLTVFGQYTLQLYEDNEATNCLYIGAVTNSHGFAARPGPSTPVVSALIDLCIFHGFDEEDNVITLGGGDDITITNNIFVGNGSAISSIGTSSSGLGTRLAKNNTFAMSGWVGGVGGIGWLQESSPDYPFTILKDNIYYDRDIGTISGNYAVDNTFVDNINYSGYNAFYDPSATLDRYTGILMSDWTSESNTIAYVSGTQFTVAGDQTLIYTATTRVQATITDDRMIRDEVQSSSFGGGLTTVVLSRSVLDSGLSKIEYSTGLETENVGIFGGADLSGSIDPEFSDKDADLISWSVLQGGTGTDAEKLYFVSSELVKINGVAEDGTVATPASWSITDIQEYITNAYTPANLALQGTASDGGDIGAVDVAFVASTLLRTKNGAARLFTSGSKNFMKP